MDSDQNQTALIGLDMTISCGTDAQVIRKTHEKQNEEDNSCTE